MAKVFQIFGKFSKKKRPFPEFSKGNLEKFQAQKEIPFQPCQHKWEGCIYGNLFFNCQKRKTLRTRPERASHKVSRSAALHGPAIKAAPAGQPHHCRSALFRLHYSSLIGRRSSVPSLCSSPKTLRDSRRLSKRLAPSHVLPPSVAMLLRAALVTSHNRFYVIGPTGFFQKGGKPPLKHKRRLCDIWGARQRPGAKLCAKASTLFVYGIRN